MNKFSEAYDCARAALQGGNLAGEFKKLQQPLARLVCGASGPDTAEKEQLEKLRNTIGDAAKKLAAKVATAEHASAKAIIGGAGSGKNLDERAATLKMLSHLYHQQSAGSQQVWVYSPPAIYSKWLFDEVAGANSVTLEDVLAKPGPEVYSATQRAIMATAVQEARAVAMDVTVKLGQASDTTMAVVRRYFGNASSTNKDLLDTMLTLAAGYKKIANACNDGNLIISDEPVDRSGGGWKDWAFIYNSEAMGVIYLQGAWLKKADEITPSNTSPLYRCVRTIIHELSHKQVGTEDIVYGPKGLKPDGSNALTPAYAIHNADSWAYFAVDVLGYLTGPDKVNGDTPTSAIRVVPTRSLTV